MLFELIIQPENLEKYGNIPCLPDNPGAAGERYVGEESDSWLLLENLVPVLDDICENDLSYGDVDYFDANKCRHIKNHLEKVMGKKESSRLSELYQTLYMYVSKAIDLGTGVVIEL